MVAGETEIVDVVNPLDQTKLPEQPVAVNVTWEPAHTAVPEDVITGGVAVPVVIAMAFDAPDTQVPCVHVAV